MTIAETLYQNLNLKKINKSKSGALLLFPQNYIAEKYRNFFDISFEKGAFDEAFEIVTNGKGNEISKINSVISSSLLSLLCFYPLFKNSDNKIISFNLNINDQNLQVPFNKSFFEIRNKVIKSPSCMDIVLQSTDKTKLLFLESKFCEYLDKNKTEKYGITYYNELYKDEPLFTILKDNGIVISKKGKKMLMVSKNEKYIAGIKQTISHIIGILRGPQEETDSFYSKEYLESYKKAYNDASMLIYGTILYNPCDLGNEEAKNDFDNYKKLYSNIIGNNGSEILKQIKNSPIIKEKNSKKICILSEPLTYQQFLLHNQNYSEILSEKIKKFYKF